MESINRNRISILRRQFSQASFISYVDWRTIVCFFFPFIIYLLTLAPTIFHLDSAELTTAAATLGLTRATGYPLYLILGHLWSWIPLGDIGFRLNLFSAFNGAITIVLLERVLRRLELNPWTSLGAVSVFAFSIYFWELSLIAEVYTLHTALMAGIIFALLRWAEDPVPWRLSLVSLLVGLSLGNHLSTILLIPGIIWFLLASHRRRIIHLRTIAFATLSLLVGLSVYLYLPVRYAANPAFNYAGHYDASGLFQPLNLQSLHGILWLISGKDFSEWMFINQGILLWSEVIKFGSNLWYAFNGLGIGPGLIGLIILFKRNRAFWGMTLLMFVFHAAFYLGYGAIDKELMFLPNYMIWAIWLAVGYDWLLNLVTTASTKKLLGVPISFETLLVLGAILAVTIITVSLNWSYVDHSKDWSARERGESLLQNLETNALVLGYWDTVPLIEYLQLVEGQRPDVQAVNRFFIDPVDLGLLVQREIQNRPVYIDKVPPNWSSNIEAQPVGVVYRLLSLE